MTGQQNTGLSTPLHLKGESGTSSNPSAGTKPTVTMTQVSFEVNLKGPEQGVHLVLPKPMLRGSPG